MLMLNTSTCWVYTYCLEVGSLNCYKLLSPAVPASHSLSLADARFVPDQAMYQ